MGNKFNLKKGGGRHLTETTATPLAPYPAEMNLEPSTTVVHGTPSRKRRGSYSASPSKRIMYPSPTDATSDDEGEYKERRKAKTIAEKD
jgi:hypothetical protein